MNQIKVLLVEDHEVVRQGIRKLLEMEKDIEIIGEAKMGTEAVELNKKYRPDVIIMDLAMPNLNGFEATRKILKATPTTKILVLSAHNEDAYIEKAIEVGVVGYLLKQSSLEVLVKAIRKVHNGKTFFTPSVLKRFESQHLKTFDRKGVLKTKNISLSPRESEVLQLIAEGEANKQIADSLNISIKTVEKHRQHLMDKLDIHDTAGLTRFAISSGVIENNVKSIDISD